MKKILIFWLWHRNWDSRIFYKQAISLKKQFDVECIWWVFSDRKWEWKDEWIKNIWLKWNRLIVLLKARWYGIKNKADIYVSHDLDSYIVIFLIKLFRWNSKIIFDVHEYYEKMRNDKTLLKSHRIFYFIYTFILKPLTKFLFNWFTVVTPLMKEKFYKSKNTEVVYNFPISKFMVSNSEDKYVADAFVLLYQGWVSKRRWIMEYLRMVKELKDRTYNIKLILLGPIENDEFAKEITNFVKKYNLEGVVEIPGKVPFTEVWKYIEKSHVWLNFLDNSFNNRYWIQIKVFEYIHFSKPVLGTNNNIYFKRFIVDEWAWLAVEYWNINEAVKAIENIYKNYKEFVNNCKRIKNKYTRENEEKKLLNFYDRFFM